MKNVSNIFIVILLSGLITSCSGFLDENPYGSVTPATFYKTADDAIMAGNSCYRQLNDPTSFWASGLDAVGDIQSDDIFPFLGWTGVMPTYQFDGNHEAIKGVWTSAYIGISRCNTCIDNVSPMNNINETIKNEVLGQAYFIRAYWYFRLVRLYGGVPLITKEYVSLENLTPPRASVSDIYTQIIADLTFATNNLREQWPSTEAGRITKGAAMAYLASVYLTQNNWSEAEKWAGRVMELEDEGVYTLLPDFATIHLESNKNSKESIFEKQYSTTHYTNWRPVYFGPRGINLGRHAGYGWIQCSKSIVAEFEPNDERFAATFFQDGEKMLLGTTEFTYKAEMASTYGPTNHDVKKGNVFYGSSRNVGLNTIVMRYAEVILFRAEALNELDRTSEAIPLLKRIRDRAGVETETSYTQSEMRDAIRHERRVEFAFEDVRGWDIIRWGIQAETLGTLPGSKWQENKCELWPLPMFVFTENPNITKNNPGW